MILKVLQHNWYLISLKSVLERHVCIPRALLYPRVSILGFIWPFHFSLVYLMEWWVWGREKAINWKGLWWETVWKCNTRTASKIVNMTLHYCCSLKYYCWDFNIHICIHISTSRYFQTVDDLCRCLLSCHRDESTGQEGMHITCLPKNVTQ